MTPAQLVTLKVAILADPVLNAYPQNSDGAYNMAIFLDQPATPDFIVWKTSVDPDEVMKNGMDWTRVDNLSVGKARIWDWMSRLGTFNPSKTNIRAGIDAAWVGTAADLAVRAMVYTHCKRLATKAEKLFASGTGSDAAPAVMTIEGRLQYSDIEQARSS